MGCRCLGSGGVCYAQPDVENVEQLDYRPESEFQKKYCKNEGFSECPKYKAIMRYLFEASKYRRR